MSIVYCIERVLKTCLSAGPVPEVWGSISGMKDLDFAALSDLTWAGYPNYGFLQRQAALDFGVAESELNAADVAYQKSLVPSTVTVRQARLALLNAGLLDDVEAYIAAIADPAVKKAAEIEWEYASAFERTSALLNTIATDLGWTEQQLDDLFVDAALL